MIFAGETTQVPQNGDFENGAADWVTDGTVVSGFLRLNGEETATAVGNTGQEQTHWYRLTYRTRGEFPPGDTGTER